MKNYQHYKIVSSSSSTNSVSMTRVCRIILPDEHWQNVVKLYFKKSGLNENVKSCVEEKMYNSIDDKGTQQ